MNIIKRLFLTFSLACISYQAQAQSATYVIVHGAWGGAWQFKNVDRKLSEAGNLVYRPTLTGLGERYHLADTAINLQTHIDDVVNTILFEDLHDLVLVGHSYGGVVISGVASRLPDRIKRLVFIDAILPESGESVSSLMKNSSFSQLLEQKVDYIPPVWVKDTTKTPRDVPHPIRTFTQKIEINTENLKHIPGTYILTYDTGKTLQEDDFYPFYLRAAAKNYQLVELEADHNPQIKKLNELVTLLLDAK